MLSFQHKVPKLIDQVCLLIKMYGVKGKLCRTNFTGMAISFGFCNSRSQYLVANYFFLPWNSNLNKSQWKVVFKWIFQGSCLCQFHQTHNRSNSLDHKRYETIVLRNCFMIFGQVWVGATLEKNKFGIPTFLGQKFWVVPWSSI